MDTLHAAAFALTGHNHSGTYDNYASWTVKANTDTGAAVASGGFADFIANNGIAVSRSGTALTFSHVDTSTQATSTNSGATFIQSVTLDTYGHVTALTPVTISCSTITAQPQLNGTGFVKASGTTISYDNSTYLTGITKSQVQNALTFNVIVDRSDGGDYNLAARMSGVYAISGTGTNGPGTTYLNLLHMTNSTDVAFQIAGGYNSDNMYFRGTSNLAAGTGYTA